MSWLFSQARLTNKVTWGIMLPWELNNAANAGRANHSIAFISGQAEAPCTLLVKTVKGSWLSTGTIKTEIKRTLRLANGVLKIRKQSENIGSITVKKYTSKKCGGSMALAKIGSPIRYSYKGTGAPVAVFCSSGGTNSPPLTLTIAIKHWLYGVFYATGAIALLAYAKMTLIFYSNFRSI